MISNYRGTAINDKASVVGIDLDTLEKLYKLWFGILVRIHPKQWEKRSPTYRGCTLGDGFNRFSDFAKWAVKQIGFDVPRFQIDKDLLSNGSKVYSPDTCVFVPHQINSLMLWPKSTRCGLPPGVRANRNRFEANCKVEGKCTYFGIFDTPELAFEAYKKVKKAEIVRVAELWKEQIDPRAYMALINYEIKDRRLGENDE